jgi:hypothetical protein
MSVVRGILIGQDKKGHTMGQYHSIYNLDKREVIHPHDIGLGAKQREHTGHLASLSDMMYILTTCSPMRGGGDFYAEVMKEFIGRWAGDRVVVIGDYAEQSDLPDLDFATLADFHSIAGMARAFIFEVYGITFISDEYGWVRRYPDPDNV